MRNLIRLIAMSLAITTLTACQASTSQGALRADTESTEHDIAGMWRCHTYVLADGSSHPLDGHISFASRDWMVLFFVLDDRGAALRGSGEGGTYELEGDRLTFIHRRVLATGVAVGSLPDSPLRMEVNRAGLGKPEAARVKISGSSMTIFFPSGNRIHFTRIK